MNDSWGGVPTQFINDLDPYGGERTIPAPLAVEHNSESAWQDFQDTETRMDAEYAATQMAAL